ncbi:hypothetical protein BDY17DRAFT_353267, partial [Neohortaea acidophila]
ALFSPHLFSYFHLYSNPSPALNPPTTNNHGAPDHPHPPPISHLARPSQQQQAQARQARQAQKRINNAGLVAFNVATRLSHRNIHRHSPPHPAAPGELRSVVEGDPIGVGGHHDHHPRVGRTRLGGGADDADHHGHQAHHHYRAGVVGER